ncbi:hypothetical protein NL108_017752 [Boleophthalmus pectinirostris]|nr:hypothetical protein NL108_017752 [Boleophthalmus pectinirostris]
MPSLRMYEDQCKDREGADSDASSSEPPAGRDTSHSPLGPGGSPLRFRPGRDEKTCTDSEHELDPHEDACPGSTSPGAQPVSPYSSRCEDPLRDRPPEKKEHGLFGVRALEKDKAERRKDPDALPKDSDSSGGISATKDAFSPLMVQTESSHFSPGHLQSLALSGLHGQQFFNPLSTGSPLLFHPSQFAMGPAGAFSAMGMSHLLASVSGAGALENGSLSSQSAAGGGAFPFHLSQHMLASQGLHMPPFGGLFPYPYTYMAAAAAAASASALPGSSSNSPLSRNPFIASTRPRLRFNPYQLPVSLPQSSGASLLSSGLLPAADCSKSGSRESSPPPEILHKVCSSGRASASPKSSVKDSVNELQSIQRLVSGLEGQRDSSPSAEPPN